MSAEGAALRLGCRPFVPTISIMEKLVSDAKEMVGREDHGHSILIIACVERSSSVVAAKFWLGAKSNKKKGFSLFLADLDHLRCLLRNGENRFRYEENGFRF